VLTLTEFGERGLQSAAVLLCAVSMIDGCSIICHDAGLCCTSQWAAAPCQWLCVAGLLYLPGLPPPTCHPHTPSSFHALQPPALPASIGRRLVLIASVSVPVRPACCMPSNGVLTRQPRAGGCAQGLLHVHQPSGRLRPCGGCAGMPAVLSRRSPRQQLSSKHSPAARLAAPPACPAGQYRPTPAEACISECCCNTCLIAARMSACPSVCNFLHSTQVASIIITVSGLVVCAGLHLSQHPCGVLRRHMARRHLAGCPAWGN